MIKMKYAQPSADSLLSGSLQSPSTTDFDAYRGGAPTYSGIGVGGPPSYISHSKLAVSNFENKNQSLDQNPNRVTIDD